MAAPRTADKWATRGDFSRGYFGLMEAYFIPEDPTMVPTDDTVLAERCGRGQWSPVSIGWTPEKPEGLFSNRAPKELTDMTGGASPVSVVAYNHDVIVSIPDFIITYVELNDAALEEKVVNFRPLSRHRTLAGLIKLIDEWAGARERFANREVTSSVAVKARDYFATLYPEMLETVRNRIPDTPVAATITRRPVDLVPVEDAGILSVIANTVVHNEDTQIEARSRRQPPQQGPAGRGQ